MTYYTLEELLNTTKDMEILRNNVANRTDTDIIEGVNWFKFNNVVAETIYVNGQSWIGFGVSAENFRINRRDGWMYYLYRQEGTIGPVKFLKIRWEGYARYNYTTAAYRLGHEVFIFDTGAIYLNFFQVPTQSGYLGTNQLISGTNTYTFTTTLGTPIEYTFHPQEPTGSSWTVANGRPTLYSFKPTGTFNYSLNDLNIETVTSSLITWKDIIPTGTSLSVSVSTDGISYTSVSSGEPILSTGINVDNLYLKIEMSTTNSEVSPEISEVMLLIKSADDSYVLTLHIQDNRRFNSAVGNISVEYDNEIGTLTGVGGPVDSFSLSFAPTDLIAKPHQMTTEHVEISNITAAGDLIRIYYRDTKCDEHIEISNITAVGVLTNINDI